MDSKREVEIIGGPGDGRATTVRSNVRWLEIPAPLGGNVDALYWTFHYRITGNKAVWIRRN